MVFIIAPPAAPIVVIVARKTLSDVESERGSYKIDILAPLFKPFALR